MLPRTRTVNGMLSGQVRLQQLVQVDTAREPLLAVSLESLVSEVAELLDERLSAVPARLQIIKGLPPVMADARQLRLVFWYLFDNAMTHASGEPLAITVDASEQGGRVTVEIEDNAAGVDLDRRTQVFDLFFQGKLPPEGELAGGIGVGLAMVRRIIERHGGDVWVELEPGSFTRVKFTLRRSRNTMSAA